MMDEVGKCMRPYLKKYGESLEPPELVRARLLALAALEEPNKPVLDGAWNWPVLKTGPTSAWLCLTRLHSLGWKGGIG